MAGPAGAQQFLPRVSLDVGFGLNLATGEEIGVATLAGYDCRPAIDGDVVAWEQWHEAPDLYDLCYAIIPEPSFALLAAVGLPCLLRRRRTHPRPAAGPGRRRRSSASDAMARITIAAGSGMGSPPAAPAPAVQP